MDHDAAHGLPARKLRVLVAVAGVGWIVLFVAGFVVAGDPGLDDGAAIARHFEEHRDAVLAGTYLGALAMAVLVVWAWSVRELVARVAPAENRLGTDVLVAGALMAGVELPVLVLDGALAFVADQPLDPGLARFVHNLSLLFSYADWLPTALLFAAVGRAALRSGILPRWLGWWALALGPVALVVAFPPLGLDPLGAGVAFLWFLASGAVLVRRALRAHGERALPTPA